MTSRSKLIDTYAFRPFMVALLFILISVAPAPAQEEANDPLIGINRAIFSFNLAFDDYVLDPVQTAYGYVVPEPVRDGVKNFTTNIGAPVSFVNDLLQGNREGAGLTLQRFMVNSTFGLLGVLDAASYFGIDKPEREDFGQTLATYGVGEGAYLVLPFLGPSTVRDAGGLLVDSFVISPWGYVVDPEVIVASRVAQIVDTRHRFDAVIDDLEENSLDLYIAYRSVYRQRREDAIRDGAKPENNQEYDDIFEEDFE